MKMFASVRDLELMGMSADPMNDSTADIRGEKGRCPVTQRTVMANIQ
jgi:hypothetical protein